MSKAFSGVAWVVFLVLGLVQLAATLEGLDYWLGWPWLILAFISFFLAYIPVVGTIAGIVGAVYGWGMPWLWALGLFIGPWVCCVVFSIIMSAMEAAAERPTNRSTAIRPQGSPHRGRVFSVTEARCLASCARRDWNRGSFGSRTGMASIRARSSAVSCMVVDHHRINV